LLLSQDRSDCSLTVPDRESLLLSIYAEWLTYYELFCQRWGWSANVVSERMVIRLRYHKGEAMQDVAIILSLLCRRPETPFYMLPSDVVTNHILPHVVLGRENRPPKAKKKVTFAPHVTYSEPDQGEKSVY